MPFGNKDLRIQAIVFFQHLLDLTDLIGNTVQSTAVNITGNKVRLDAVLLREGQESLDSLCIIVIAGGRSADFHMGEGFLHLFVADQVELQKLIKGAGKDSVKAVVRLFIEGQILNIQMQTVCPTLCQVAHNVDTNVCPTLIIRRGQYTVEIHGMLDLLTKAELDDHILRKHAQIIIRGSKYVVLGIVDICVEQREDSGHINQGIAGVFTNGIMVAHKLCAQLVKQFLAGRELIIVIKLRGVVDTQNVSQAGFFLIR